MDQALEEHGVDAHTQAVDGSFCDGRYNLAVGAGQEARKIAGTAQVWRRQAVGSAQEHIQVVLVHALILAGVDVSAVDRKSVVEGQGVSVRVGLGGRRMLIKKNYIYRSIHDITTKIL